MFRGLSIHFEAFASHPAIECDWCFWMPAMEGYSTSDADLIERTAKCEAEPLWQTSRPSYALSETWNLHIILLLNHFFPLQQWMNCMILYDLICCVEVFGRQSSCRIAALLDDDTYAVRAKACFLLGKVNATNQAAWSLALQNAMNLCCLRLQLLCGSFQEIFVENPDNQPPLQISSD